MKYGKNDTVLDIEKNLSASPMHPQYIPTMNASITIPFGLNRAVNITSISNVALRLRTTSTSTYILADVLADAINLEEGWATFNLIAKNDERVNDINES